MTPELRRTLGTKRAEVCHLIRHEMRKRGYSAKGLAEHLGCSDANIHRAISGTSHSPLVLDALREIGVPEALLFDPRMVRVPSVQRTNSQRKAL